MSTPTRRLKGRGSRSTLSSILSLASSYWRHSWFLLLIMTIGMVAAVVIVCTVPLFANVMNTAGLRQELRADPNSAEIEINTTTLGLSTQVAANVQDLFAALMKQDLGDLAQPSQFTILSSNFAFATPSKDARSCDPYFYTGYRCSGPPRTLDRFRDTWLRLPQRSSTRSK